jgi:hypothetical protein
VRQQIPFAFAVEILILVGCSGGPERDVRADSARRVTDAVNRFDPAVARRGDTVAELVIDSIQRERALSGEWVGSARFAGTVLLSGRTFRHPDGDDYPFPCFEADSASARRLPRWAGDERRPWFCFENASAAKTMFGGAGGDRRATIRVDRFTIYRNLSDAVNQARLIEVVSVGDSTESAVPQCFVTSRSALARSPGTAAPGPEGLTGWVRVDDLARADSGAARLADSDGRVLSGTWRRFARDSITIVAFDDFVRVEMRLAESTADGMTGSATARSDAATERDSAGRSVPFERRWIVDGRRAPCERMPSRPG